MVKLTKQGEVEALNMFIEDGGHHNRLDEATVDNVMDIKTDIANNPRLVNELMNTMFNKIGSTYFNSLKFENPLKKFKRETQTYGDTIEEVFIGLADEVAYDSDAKGTGKRLLSTEEMKVQAEYHKVNRESTFPATILQKKMVRALRTPGGLQSLVSNELGKLVISNELAEYKYMRALLDGAYQKGDLYLVEAGEITNDIDNTFGQKARMYELEIGFENTYNAAGVPNVSTGDISIIMSAETRSKFDTQTLAGAFNMDKADLEGSQIVIDKFADPNVLAVLVDNSFFVVQDKMPAQITSQHLADSLKTNYFLNVDQIISRSPFATAIAFVKEIPADMKHKLNVSKTSVVLDDSEDGKTQEVYTKLVGFDKIGNIEDYTITVESGFNPISTTTVDVNGTITITLKPDIPAGETETLVIVAKADVGSKEISHKATIRVQKSSKITI